MAARIGLQGFEGAMEVALSNGGAFGSTGPDGWPAQIAADSTGPTAQIVLRRSQLQVAPEGINFEVVVDGFDTPGPASAANPYDPQFHRLYYFWDFGDPGSVFTAPQHVPDVHTNRCVLLLVGRAEFYWFDRMKRRSGFKGISCDLGFRWNA